MDDASDAQRSDGEDGLFFVTGRQLLIMQAISATSWYFSVVGSLRK